MTAIDFSEPGALVLPEAVPTGPPQVEPPSLLERFKSFFGLRGELQRTTVPNPASPPWNAVCLLNFFRAGQFQGYATGFLVKPDVLVTAAHNLQLTQPGAVGIYPGYDAKLNPSPGVSGRAWAWDGSRDIAVVILASPVSVSLKLRAPAGDELALGGYAFPYDDNRPRMTAGGGEWRAHGARIQYRIGVAPGDSGAAVMAGSPLGFAAAIHSESKIVVSAGGLVGIGEPVDADFMIIVKNLEVRARGVS